MNTSRLLPNLWANFDRLQGEMDRLLEGWGVDLTRGLVPAFPPVNVWEDAEAFHVEAELPGMTREQVQIAVTHKNQLTLTGERLDQEPETGRWHRRERGFGRFQRILKLPLPVDADRVDAKLEDGLLQVTLPKAEECKPRKIVVKAE
ncbi:MAG: Hsp20/alpha crystallin family protein [Gemmataceae bacterium]